MAYILVNALLKRYEQHCMLSSDARQMLTWKKNLWRRLTVFDLKPFSHYIEDLSYPGNIYLYQQQIFVETAIFNVKKTLIGIWEWSYAIWVINN